MTTFACTSASVTDSGALGNCGHRKAHGTEANENYVHVERTECSGSNFDRSSSVPANPFQSYFCGGYWRKRASDVEPGGSVVQKHAVCRDNAVRRISESNVIYQQAAMFKSLTTRSDMQRSQSETRSLATYLSDQGAERWFLLRQLPVCCAACGQVVSPFFKIAVPIWMDCAVVDVGQGVESIIRI